MGYKSTISKPFCNWIARDTTKWTANAARDQDNIMKQLIKKARNTQFGKDHQFASINDHLSFAACVPLRDYEELRPYIDMILAGEKDVLWPGKPKYLAKT